MQEWQTEGLGLPTLHLANTYDTLVLQQLADQWRIKAATVTAETIRVFCLAEAERYERRLQKSLFTPAIRGSLLPNP